MDWKRIIIAGIVSGIVIFAVSAIIRVIVQAILPYNVLELGGMRATTDPVIVLFFLHPWVIGFTMAILYEKTKSSFQGTYVQKGAMLGLLVWLVASLSSAFAVYTSINYPLGFKVDVIIGTFLYMLAAGIVTAKLM